MGPIQFYLAAYFLVCVSATDTTELNFIGDFTSNYNIYSSFYNLIVCKKFDSISLIKMLSERFERFVAVHGEDESFERILDEPQTFILNVDCPHARQILQRADNLGLFKKPYQWLLLTQTTNSAAQYRNTSEVKNKEWYWNYLANLSILIDSDFQVIEKMPKEKVVVAEVYKITKDKQLLKKPLLKWSLEEGLTVLNTKSITVRRLDLRGAVLPASLVITNPDSLNHLDDLVDRHIDISSKVSYNVIKHYEDFLNMRATYKIVDAWGVYENGSWSGMLGDIERGVADYGAAPLFLKENRLSIIEYYAMVNPTGTKFIFISPPVSYSNNIFLMPFDDIVWYCCISMVVVSCFLLFTALKAEKIEVTEKGKTVEKTTFTEILLLNVGAICLQGTAAPAKGPAGRIITLFLYFSYMFLYISYSASIVAILQSSDHSISTFADILRSPLKAGAEDIGYSKYYFTTADDEIRKAIYRQKIAPKGESPHFLPVEEGIKKVREGLYAFHVELSSGYQIIQKTFTEEEKCGLQESKTSFLKAVDPWIVMKKKTPYGEIFKYSIKKIIETGFKSWAVRRYYTKKPVCSIKGSRFVSVGMYDCYYAFMFLICGSTVSVIIMIFEIIVSKYLSRKPGKKNIKSDRVLLDDVFMIQ